MLKYAFLCVILLLCALRWIFKVNPIALPWGAMPKSPISASIRLPSRHPSTIRVTP